MGRSYVEFMATTEFSVGGVHVLDLAAEGSQEAALARWSDDGGDAGPIVSADRDDLGATPTETAMNKLRPLENRVMIKRMTEETTSRGGIIIPDTAKEKPIEGEVIAVGNGKLQEDGIRRPVGVKVGDQVLFGKYTGSEVTIEGEQRLIIREDDILAVIEK